MIENMEDYSYQWPADPDANVNEYEKESWKKQLVLYWKQRGIYIDNKMKLYSYYGDSHQRGDSPKLQPVQGKYDSLGFLKIIQEFVFKSHDHLYKYGRYTEEQYKQGRERILNKKVVYGILTWADREGMESSPT